MFLCSVGYVVWGVLSIMNSYINKSNNSYPESVILQHGNARSDMAQTKQKKNCAFLLFGAFAIPYYNNGAFASLFNLLQVQL